MADAIFLPAQHAFKWVQTGRLPSKYSGDQIIEFLKLSEAGMPVAEICRKGGFSDATF